MKVLALLVIACSLWESQGYPYDYYPYYYASNMDTLSVGSSDSSKGGMALSRYYNPYYTPGYTGGMAAFMFKPQEQPQEAPRQYYTQPRPQTPQETFTPPKQQEVYVPPTKTQYQDYPPSPQQNEVYPPEKTPTTELVELSDFTTESSITTAKSVTPSISVLPIEPELAEVEEVEDTKPRKRVSKKRPVKKPVVEEDEEEEEYPRTPMGALFPMFFGYGRNGMGGSGGATAIANAYSSAKGGVASSHATAFGEPQPDLRQFQIPDKKKYREPSVRL